MKYFIWLIIIISIIILCWFQCIRKILIKDHYFKKDINHKQSEKTEIMVQCDNCGLYFPISEAFKKNNSEAIYCSKDHLKSS